MDWRLRSRGGSLEYGVGNQMSRSAREEIRSRYNYSRQEDKGV